MIQAKVSDQRRPSRYRDVLNVYQSKLIPYNAILVNKPHILANRPNKRRLMHASEPPQKK